MSESEKKITDVQGQYMLPMRDGLKHDDANWQACRIVLTDKRLVLITDEKLTVPLADIEEIGGRLDVNQAAAQMANYINIHLGDDVVLVSAAEHHEFETDFYHACLNGEILFVRHPAVEGGVVQSTEWNKARVKISDEAIKFALSDGGLVEIDRDDIGEVETDQKEVAGEQRRLFEVEHSEDGISVETYISGTNFQTLVLGEVLEEGVERNRADIDLGPVEKQIVMALHSGVSPFELPDFVGVEVAEVEEIFDRLIELDVIEVVRERTEVEMTARGRGVAGDSMSQQ
jgi:helix-turn-helix protein